MGVLATDNFNRADASPIGAPWTTQIGSQAMKIVSNACTPVSTSMDCGAYNTSASWPNDQYSQCKVTATGGASADLGIGPAVRCSTSATTFYRAVWNGAATNNITLTKAVAGSYTLIWTRTATISAGSVLRIEAQGTAIRVFVNGTQVGASTTDSSITSGSAGVQYSSAITTASLDDWEGGDFSASNVNYTSTLTASIGFTSADALGTDKTLPSAAVGFTSRQARAVATRRAGSVSFASAQTRATKHSLSASLPFTGTTTRNVSRAVLATMSFASAQLRKTAHSLVASVNFTGSVTTQAVHRFIQALSATIGFTGSMTTQAVRFFQQALSATLAFTGRQSLNTAHRQTAAVSFTSAQTRRTRTLRAASVGFTSLESLRTNHLTTAAIGFTTAQTRRVTRTFAGVISLAASLTTATHHFFLQALNATLGFTGALASSRVFSKALSATLGFTSTIHRRMLKLQSSAISFASSRAVAIRARFVSTFSLHGNFVVTPSLLSALSNLRERIFGREPGNTSGREPSSDVHYRRSDGASGREDGT